VKSFLLQALARLLLPFAILIAVALLLKGHDAPGGGFVAGLSLAVAGVLALTAWGTRRFEARIPIAPEQVALAGAIALLAGALLPLLTGQPVLSHRHGVLHLVGADWKWSTALLFDAGVVLAVGGGFGAAALRLWEARPGGREA
jgi:multisubunit Na+/H+ antiporter MnhB subunit